MRIGIDLGGTKIAGVALRPDGSEIARLRIPTPRSYDGTLAAIAAMVAELDGAAGVRGSVGLGIPGALSPTTGLVRNANSTWLIGEALDHDLAELLGRPVRIMNDANCFALSEASDGAGEGASCVFGVILGTGVGGGIVMDGRVVQGASRVAGEWGHNPLPAMRDDERPGPLCYCGRLGCVETFLSGPGIAADHLRVTGNGATSPEIVGAAALGDAQAMATLERHVDRLARALGVVINILDPDVVVLGGGVSNTPHLPERVQSALPPYVFTDDLAVRVVRHRHGDASGVRGAAWLWGPDRPAG